MKQLKPHSKSFENFIINGSKVLYKDIVRFVIAAAFFPADRFIHASLEEEHFVTAKIGSPKLKLILLERF